MRDPGMFPGLSARLATFFMKTQMKYNNNKKTKKHYDVGVRRETQSVAPGEGEGGWGLPQGEGDVQEV